MRKSISKQTLPLLLLLSTTLPVHAAEFFITYKSQMNKSYFNSEIKVKKIFSTLDVVAVDAKNIHQLDYLRLDPNIINIEKSVSFKAPEKFISKAYPKLKKESAFDLPAIKPPGIGIVKADKVWSTTEGEGVRVLILDTGIDKNHPAVSSNFEKGKNFTSKDETNFSDHVGHGTHVAGTIAANGPLLGVAPHVKFLSGKVCQEGGCGTYAILSGIEWGIQERVDVINMSLGGTMSSSFAEHVYKKAEDNDIVVIAASGNDGKQIQSFPASYSEVFSVGAVDDNLMIAKFSNWNSTLDVVAPGVNVYSSVPEGTGRAAVGKVYYGNQTVNLKLKCFTGTNVESFKKIKIAYAGFANASQKEEMLDTVDLKGKIALVERGENTFKEKLDYVTSKGAVGMIVYNNTAGELNGTLGKGVDSPYIAVTMDEQAGQFLATILKNEKNVTADIEVDATDYAFYQGTSMATPHVAGVAALIRSVNPKLTATEVKNLLRSTAIPTHNAGPEKYGHGLVDAYSAAEQARAR